MNLNNLKKQVTKNRKRVGQGISAGQGKTAGRGTKGQNSRTGHKLRPGFEGGQMPLAQRLPKSPGFKALTKKATTVSLKRLSVLKDGEKVTVALLHKLGFIESAKESVKIVGDEAAGKKIKVAVPISKKAAELVKKDGGTVEK